MASKLKRYKITWSDNRIQFVRGSNFPAACNNVGIYAIDKTKLLTWEEVEKDGRQV